MALRTKSSVKTLFQTGDKPTQVNFEDLIDTMVAIPTAATYPSFIELEAVASATARPVGAVGRRLVEASSTSKARDPLAVVSLGAFGSAFAGTGTTAAARDLLAITAGSSAGAVGAVIF